MLGFNRQSDDNLNITTKANLVLNVVLVAILLIILRVWHLTVIQYDARLEQSRKPQQRTFIEPAKRGTIRDRFNLPLAINKVQYNVSILYSQLKQIPAVKWEYDVQGKKVKVFKRKDYIAALAKILGRELSIDTELVEDRIHAKGPFYHQIPFLIKEDITEKQYYRLKMLQKDWLAIHVQCIPKRCYPQGRVTGEMVGYMGAISRPEYDAILDEMKNLENFIELAEAGEVVDPPEGMKTYEQVIQRLKQLQERAYAINDFIGKTGIEGRFEEILRGVYGKKSYFSDSRGNYLRELPGSREPLSGQRLLLSISSELQQYAEELLIQNEKIRQTRMSTLDASKHTFLADKQPWIKGGAIVVLDPYTGEVLTLASYPRYDPNDFINKSSNVVRWLENETYLAEIWDQKRSLERETYNDDASIVIDERRLMSWENYLDLVLGLKSPIKESLKQINDLSKSVEFLREIKKLLKTSEQESLHILFNFLYPQDKPHGKLSSVEKEHLQNHLTGDEKGKLEPYLANLPLNYEKVLLVDLVGLVVAEEKFTDLLLKKVGRQTLSFYRSASSAFTKIHDVAQKMTKELFHEFHFKNWRKTEEKEFLKQKRAEEKDLKRSPRPYIDLLDAKESEMFKAFWQEHKWDFLLAFLAGEHLKDTVEPYLDHFLAWQKEIDKGAHQAIEWKSAYQILKNAIKDLNGELAKEYLMSLRSFQDLTRPLYGKYRSLRSGNYQQPLEKHLALAFYPKNGYGFGRSQAYRQAATQGSIFKLVTAYEGLVQKYQQIDKKKVNYADINPLEIVDQVSYRGKELFVGYDDQGEPLPRFYKGGRLPKSAHSALGKIDLIKAIENSSNPYFAILAGDKFHSPQDLVKAAKQFSYGSKTGIDLPGEISGSLPNDLEYNRTGLYSLSIGQHTLVVTPLQTAIMLATIANGGYVLKPKIVKMKIGESLISTPTLVKHKIFMPELIKNVLLEGMYRVMLKTQADSLGSLSRLYHDYPEAISDYLEMKHQLIGKTSTAESMENIDLDWLKGTNMYTHVWFGGISFDQENAKGFLFNNAQGKAEVVVVVYLRYGGYGKEAAPIAAQIAKKWSEIKSSRLTSDGI